MNCFSDLERDYQGTLGFFFYIVQFQRLMSISMPQSFAYLSSLLVVPIRKLPLLVFWNLLRRWKSCMWKDMAMKLSELKVRRGRAYSLRVCMQRLIGLLKMPKVESPGKRVRREMMKELAEELECAKITTLFWQSTAFQIQQKSCTPNKFIITFKSLPIYSWFIYSLGHVSLRLLLSSLNAASINPQLLNQLKKTLVVLASLSLRQPKRGKVLTIAIAFWRQDRVIQLFWAFISSVTLICLKQETPKSMRFLALKLAQKLKKLQSSILLWEESGMAWWTTRFQISSTALLGGYLYSISVPRLWWKWITAMHRRGSSIC